ncbi:MAG: BlaI/MecI/CopY family transcriptional regulator [Dyadobacter sp.]|uniref:BlaI/MecI/CopY family transcriptional regulator n=1 Tax=Dyadobacter sp. TaxID=1914288 RepID=UPI001B0E9304|nr:BlaI/MecI/CopY family transcriptional regulator [Dyadobacter sp.]MBO9611822.1 BlaI/MecI/CopY family transcriptional regulator [Dyadobacter sp.]
MKAKDKAPISDPTKSELEILQILWKAGPSTARFVNDELNRSTRKVIYMSTLKLMQIMVEKGLLKKDESQFKHVYFAAVEEERTKGALLDRVIDTIFGGSAGSLLMQLMGNKKLSKKEMDEYQALIKKISEQ